MSIDNPVGIEPDENSSFEQASFKLIIELQPGVVAGIEKLHHRYIEVCGNTKLDGDRWLTKGEFLLFCIRVGLGFKNMKLSDILTQAAVKGGIAVAEFNFKQEKALGLTGD